MAMGLPIGTELAFGVSGVEVGGTGEGVVVGGTGDGVSGAAEGITGGWALHALVKATVNNIKNMNNSRVITRHLSTNKRIHGWKPSVYSQFVQCGYR